MNIHTKKAKRALLLVPLAILFVLIAPAARAQGVDDAIRAREALERTDEVIGNAKNAIDESRSQKARLVLDMAAGLQSKAWNSYQGHGYRMAMKLTAEAREEAWHALALARADRQFEQNNNRVADETRDRLARLRDRMIESGVRDEQAMRLMEQARNLLEKSHLNAQQLRYQLALKLAGNARDLALRAEERIRNTRVLKESAERRLALLERLVERARERAGASGQEDARDQIDGAERQINKARELLDAGRYREAKQAIERCERTLRNSVRLMPLAPAGDPQNQLEEAYRLLDRAGEIVSGNGQPADPRTLETIDQARLTIRRAEDAFGAGRTAEGTGLLARAREMLRGAIRAEADETTRETIMMRIERIESLRDETKNLAETCPEPGVRRSHGTRAGAPEAGARSREERKARAGRGRDRHRPEYVPEDRRAMRAVIASCAALALALAFAACAGAGTSSAPATSGERTVSALSDSLETAAREDLFVEEHARLMREIQTRKDRGTPDALVLEALALVSASEEMYLQGRLDLAAKLLDEAARSLNRKR